MHTAPTGWRTLNAEGATSLRKRRAEDSSNATVTKVIKVQEQYLHNTTPLIKPSFVTQEVKIQNLLDRGNRYHSQGNYAEAINCYKQAADLGDKRGLHNLAACYGDGRGAEKNETKAFVLFQQSAQADFMPATYALGICHRDGIGTKKDPQEALQCFFKAANQGKVEALTAIARRYLEESKEAKEMLLSLQKAKKLANCITSN